MPNLTENQLKAGRHAHGVWHRARGTGTRLSENDIDAEWEALPDHAVNAWCMVAKSLFGRAANMLQSHLMDEYRGT